ncbi:MAG TPA: carotenoid oxygenase family protein [Streptosporangiaceae bacterium]|nr:carotenoid oxygenase family protein [Streptosporangiaceae bacterium]
MTSQYLTGNYRPVSREITAGPLPVTGQVPPGLRGRYLRNGPNPATPPEPGTYHWFTGDAMIHGVRLADGRAEWYRNRWVRSRPVARALGEPPPAGPVHAGMDLAVNTNVIGHAGRTLALVEAGALPVELGYCLETAGPTTFGGTLPGGYTAHPKRQPVTGELHAISYFAGWGASVQYSVTDTSGRVRHAAQIPVGGPVSVHDTAITERYVIIFDLPVLLSATAIRAGASFPYRWDPGYQARVGLLPLDGDGPDVRWFELDPCYVFHTVNAYDDRGLVVVDLVRHDRTFAVHLDGPADAEPVLERWTIDPGGGTVKREILDDRPQEFPRHDERRTGRPYRYGYATAFTGDPHGEVAIIRHDLRRGTAVTRPIGPGSGPAEPVFVPRAPDAGEEDGWLLCLSYDRDRDGSDLLILPAADLTAAPEAVIHLPVRVPAGFHGNWIDDTGLPPA